MPASGERPQSRARVDDDEEDRPRRDRPRDEDDEEDRPRRKRSRDEDDEEEERPRRRARRDEDDEEDRPRRRKRRDDDEDDEREPRPERCPECGSRRYTKVTYTWWGGLIGPAIFSMVRCDRCDTTFNRKHGTRVGATQILIYSLVGLVLALILAGGIGLLTLLK